eukprot:c8246_g1_i1.p1 GENE.c8246_g1_i1~~c8246_g1_i1.p1  ORF type:complete len:207 (+),score=32.89 c8246_g1_i1:45-665(+)
MKEQKFLSVIVFLFLLIDPTLSDISKVNEDVKIQTQLTPVSLESLVQEDVVKQQMRLKQLRSEINRLQTQIEALSQNSLEISSYFIDDHFASDPALIFYPFSEKSSSLGRFISVMIWVVLLLTTLLLALYIYSEVKSFLELLKAEKAQISNSNNKKETTDQTNKKPITRRLLTRSTSNINKNKPSIGITEYRITHGDNSGTTDENE